MTLKKKDACFRERAENEWQPEKHLHFLSAQWLSSEQTTELALCDDWPPLRRNLDHISKAVESAHYLLDLTDEDGQPTCTRATWDRAIQFLTACARRAWDAHGIKIDAPAILPGPDGSIDLHWKRTAYEMLINIPVSPSEHPSYYGDDQDGNSTKGNVVSGDNQGLILWLTKRK